MVTLLEKNKTTSAMSKIKEKKEDLFLILKTQWYNLIDCGEKKEEYRAMTEYWQNRLANREYKTVTFQLGYSDKNRMKFEVERVSIGIGKEKWGATGTYTYIIKLGKRIL